MTTETEQKTETLQPKLLSYSVLSILALEADLFALDCCAIKRQSFDIYLSFLHESVNKDLIKSEVCKESTWQTI